MKYIYSSIKLSDNESLSNYVGVDGKILESIDDLSKVNIFVGSNNSGKSRFMREMMKIDQYLFNSIELKTSDYLKYVEEISDEIFKIKKSDYAKGIISFRTDGHGSFNDGDFIQRNFKFYDYSLNLDGFRRFLSAIKVHSRFIISSSSGTYDLNSFANNAYSLYEKYESKINFILDHNIEKIEFNKIYIPINRSLNNFETSIDGRSVKEKSEVRDFFRIRAQQNYGISEDIKIFTGQDLYFEIRDMLLGDQEKRNMIANYENFLSEELFENKRVSLIPKVGSDVLNIKIGEEEKKIYDLGDGIQSLIILTFQSFICDNGIFFIEEPEINLHPGMQRKFIETILKSSSQLSDKNHQYFLTTHSNHFLDLTLDYENISIYKFSSNTTSGNKLLKNVEKVSSGDERLLKELGVKNSSVFLTNATIWVEGITDRLYIKKFLELYQDHFDDKPKISEDIDYSFVEYGGNNITHWSFLESTDPTICVDRFCAKSMLITDRDGNKKIERQRELRKKLGRSRYKCLTCNEIENILSLDTIERVIKKYPGEVNFSMPIFKDKHPHAKVKFGQFIKNKLKPRNKYDDKSGALISGKKMDFCRKAIEDLTYEEMSTLAINLASGVYNFIISQKNK